MSEQICSDNFLDKNGSYFVVAGIVSIGTFNANSQMSIVDEVYKHPEYDPDILLNDIAVLKVQLKN